MITSPATATCRLSAVSIEAIVNKEKVIPLVPAHTIKGVFTPEMKQEVIEKVAEAMVSIEGENFTVWRGSLSTKWRAVTGASVDKP
ncbi:hypothetical protein [Microvirga sp.]|uniref:hypothetical protein n=1 Tax=Microvirga sp. TaxID=1873136 RepID=UPI001AEEE34D|nr:hypothetical protein [Microvirga sp.]